MSAAGRISRPTRHGRGASRFRTARAAFGMAALAGLLAAGGCDRNSATPFLTPTGYRPPPAVGTASLGGFVQYDPQNAPDLATAPFPPTTVELLQNGEVLVIDTLASIERTFEFRELRPGRYTVRAHARLFELATIADVSVVSTPVDAGDLVLRMDPLQVSSTVHLLGDFNGFPEDFPDSISMNMNTLGVWTYPNLDYPAQVLTPGTYHFRFVTDFFVDTDYGGDESVVWSAPVDNAPTRLVSGPGTRLSFAITTAGRYQFTLDERRQTFSIQPLTESPRPISRR